MPINANAGQKYRNTCRHLSVGVICGVCLIGDACQRYSACASFSFTSSLRSVSQIAAVRQSLPVRACCVLPRYRHLRRGCNAWSVAAFSVDSKALTLPSSVSITGSCCLYSPESCLVHVADACVGLDRTGLWRHAHGRPHLLVDLLQVLCRRHCLKSGAAAASSSAVASNRATGFSAGRGSRGNHVSGCQSRHQGRC